jgi:hypothetical protein
MSTDRAHLTTASAAILSLSMVMCAAAPVNGEPAARSAADPDRRSLTREQRQAVIVLMGRLAEAARDLCPPQARSVKLAHGGPQYPVPLIITRHWPDVTRRSSPRQPAMPLSHLNLPPPSRC